MGRPAFVFVRPQLGQNLGSAARAMLNFDIADMRLVQPTAGWLNPDAVARASGAGRILDHAQVYEDLDAALKPYNYVYATSARGRNLSKPVLTPSQAMDLAARQIASGCRVAVLFGPESTGLTNQDLTGANAIVEVPANPRFSSLNLAHCALIVAYEWYRQGIGPIDGEKDKAIHQVATQADKKVLAGHFEADLDRSDFFRFDTNSDALRMFLHNMFMRLDFTVAEVKVLHRVRKALVRFRSGV